MLFVGAPKSTLKIRVVFCHFFGKSVKRFAGILSWTKILDELDWKMAELQEKFGLVRVNMKTICKKFPKF